MSIPIPLRRQQRNTPCSFLMAAFQPLRKQIVLRYDAAPLRNGRKRVLPRSNPTPPPGVFRSSFDDYMRRVYPNMLPPSSPADVKQALYAMGASDATLLKYNDMLNKKWDDIFSWAPDGRLPTLGAKPLPNDKNIQHYPIPNSPLVIRIWDGGMEQYGQYCLDFFDPVNDIAVNGPDDYKIWHNPYPGQLTYGEQLVSWEAAMHVTTVPAGEERFLADEDQWLGWTLPNLTLPSPRYVGCMLADEDVRRMRM